MNIYFSGDAAVNPKIEIKPICISDENIDCSLLRYN